MASRLKHRRIHNLLLISKVLGCWENASPFTLVVDSLEQSGQGLVREMIRRAKASKSKILYISFETLRKPSAADVFVYGGELETRELQAQIAGSLDSTIRNVIVLDTLHPLLSTAGFNLPAFLSSLMTPTVSLLAVYHADVPIAPSCVRSYLPSPLMLLQYLATTILSVHSVTQVLSKKQARDRSQPEPVYGLAEETEGVLVGLQSNIQGEVVIEMEYRRKSGRGVKEYFYLRLPKKPNPISNGKTAPRILDEMVGLLEDHPQYQLNAPTRGLSEPAEDDLTFNLVLTDQQRKDRDGVVLPYFDAQRAGSPGDGGKILYEMGVEDDFDEEEDEI